MEAKKNKRGIINIVDILIIVVLIAGIAFLAIMYNRVKNPTTAAVDQGEAVDIYFDVQLSAVREEVCSLLKEGDSIRFDARTNEYGEIYELSEPQLAEVVYSNAVEGVFEQATFSDLYDILITIKATGYENEDKITAGSLKLTVGSSVYLKTADLACSGYIFDVRTEKRGSAE